VIHSCWDFAPDNWSELNSLKHLTANAYGRRNKELLKVRTLHPKYVTQARKARKQGGQGGEAPVEDICLPWKNVLDIV